MTILPQTLPPWSFSMLEQFETCNKAAFHRYILKEKGPKSAAMEEGNIFDKAVEDRIRQGVPLPERYQKYEPLAASIANMKGEKTKVYTQLKLGLDRNFKPTGFFDNDVWARGALDVGMVNYPNFIITDWKTGKNSEGKSYSNNGLQLKIFAAFIFKHFPRVDKVTAFNIWLKTNEFGKVYVWTRADEAQLWREILPRVMAMEKAFAEGKWPPRPGPLCGYCDVLTCPHNKK